MENSNFLQIFHTKIKIFEYDFKINYNGNDVYARNIINDYNIKKSIEGETKDIWIINKKIEYEKNKNIIISNQYKKKKTFKKIDNIDYFNYSFI